MAVALWKQVCESSVRLRESFVCFVKNCTIGSDLLILGVIEAAARPSNPSPFPRLRPLHRCPAPEHPLQLSIKHSKASPTQSCVTMTQQVCAI
eukprot:2505317-Rhodomonas_salina.1